MTPSDGGTVADLPTYTDTEAIARGLYPPNAFRAFAIAPGTIRAWASAGHIQAQGTGARGARLYFFGDVLVYAKDAHHRPRTRRLSSAA